MRSSPNTGNLRGETANHLAFVGCHSLPPRLIGGQEPEPLEEAPYIINQAWVIPQKLRSSRVHEQPSHHRDAPPKAELGMEGYSDTVDLQREIGAEQ